MDDSIQAGKSADNARDVSRLGNVHLVGAQFAAANTLSLGSSPIHAEPHRDHVPTPLGKHPRRRPADTARATSDQHHRPSIILDWFHMPIIAR